MNNGSCSNNAVGRGPRDDLGHLGECWNDAYPKNKCGLVMDVGGCKGRSLRRWGGAVQVQLPTLVRRVGEAANVSEAG